MNHESSVIQVLGEAEHIDDRPPVAGEVFVDVFYSPVAHGKILSVDTAAALTVEGVVGIFSAADLDENIWGTIFRDQPYLARETVSYAGEPILVIAAETREALHLAKKKIRVDIEE